MEHRGEVQADGTGRRDFLKKAGVVAWTVPAVQVVNMAGALAGGTNTSVTTTTVPSTTRPPCREVTLRLKAVYSDRDGVGFVWTTERNDGDCVEKYDTVDPSNLPIWIGEREPYLVVSHEIRECRIVSGYAKMAVRQEDDRVGADGVLACVPGKVADNGSYIKWEGRGGEGGIYQVEIVVECCLPDDGG